MLKTAIKGILARKLRLLATAMAITLGVAFMAGTFVLTDTVKATFDDLFLDIYSDTDAVVRAEAAFEGAQNSGAQRGRVDASLVDEIEDVDGVAIVEGSVFGYARIVGSDGEPLGVAMNGPPMLGGSWSETEEVNPFQLVAGAAPTADDEVVIDKKSADDGKLAVGDTTTVLVQGGPLQVRVSGIAKFGDADSPGGASYAMFTLAAAQRVIGEVGKFDEIAVVADDGVTQDEVVRRIETLVPSGVEVLSGTQITEETQDDVQRMMSFFSTFMLVFALISLFVGAFMIFNTFSITVAQRARENALLRALGASRRQILGSVLVEALAIGVVASLIGLVAGIAVAAGLKALLAGIGLDIPAGGIVFLPRTAIVSVSLGVAVTVIAAVSPARKAAKIPPIAAMQEVPVGSTGYGSKERVMVGIALLIAGIATLFAGLFGNVGNALLVVGAGMVVVFFAVTVLGRTISLPISRVLGSPLPRFRGASGLLARENAMRNPKRTAASASALMIGVGLVGFVTIAAASMNASIGDTLDRVFTGDYLIDSGGGMMGGVDPSLAQRVSEVDGVEAVASARFGQAVIEGSPEFIVGVDAADALAVFDIGQLAGSAEALTADTIAVHKDTAEEQGLTIGDPVHVVFATGEKDLRVALIYAEQQPAGDYFLGIEAYEANFSNRLDGQIYVKRAAATDASDVLSAVKTVVADYPGAEVLNQEEFKAAQAAPMNQILTLVYVLLALAILIALLGIVNTLALSIFERTRELGLLRAVGMTRSQLRRTIRWESVLIALQGSAIGLVISIFFGWAAVSAMRDEGFTVFAIPYLSLAIIVVIAWTSGVLAAIAPSRRAAKLNVLRAIVTE